MRVNFMQNNKFWVKDYETIKDFTNDMKKQFIVPTNITGILGVDIQWNQLIRLMKEENLHFQIQDTICCERCGHFQNEGVL